MLARILLVALVLLQGGAAFAAGIVTDVVPLERNGINLHLQRVLSEEAPGERQLLLVHGLTYSSHEFDVDTGDYSLARFLASNGFTVWMLDIAGYGSSQEVEDGYMPDSNYAAEDIAAAADLVLERSGQQRLDVLGWSWGTVTGGRFAANHPEKVGKLVLYAPIVAGLGVYEVKSPFNKNTWEHAAGDFQVKEDGRIDYDITEPCVVATFLSNCWRYDGKGSPNGGRRDLLVGADERLIPTASIEAPTLLIVGDKDPYVSVELCEEAFGTLKNKDSMLKVVPGASHAMMMEKPFYKEFREAVLAFLQ